MKVFFTASQRGRKEYGKYYDLIASSIKELNLILLDDDILHPQPKEFYNKLEYNHDANVKFYQTKLKNLEQSDINILEISAHSLSIGFVIEKSLELNKPTIVLYYKDFNPLLLMGNEDEKLILKSYTEKNLKKVLEEAIAIAKERRDKRFNFFISPKLLNYLEETSKKQGITKSKFIRNLILENMRKGSET